MELRSNGMISEMTERNVRQPTHVPLKLSVSKLKARMGGETATMSEAQGGGDERTWTLNIVCP